MNINELLNSYFRLTNTIPKNFEDLRFSDLERRKLFPDLRNLIVEKYGDEKAFRRFGINGTKVRLWSSCTQEDLDSMIDIVILDCNENRKIKMCPKDVEELDCSGFCTLEEIDSVALRNLNCSNNRYLEVCPDGVENLKCSGEKCALRKIESTVLKKLDCSENKHLKVCPEGVEELDCSGFYCSLVEIESTSIKKFNCSNNRYIEVCPGGVEELNCSGFYCSLARIKSTILKKLICSTTNILKCVLKAWRNSTVLESIVLLE